MLFSIVTPSLNQGTFLEETIQSVLGQKGADFEHIVVDGLSTDGTIGILNSHRHLKWLSERDRSRTEAINKGFRMASGDILAWMSCDDLYLPDAFKKARDHFEANTACQILVGRARVIDECGQFLFDQEMPSHVSAEAMVQFWKNPLLPQPSLFFRRSVLDRIGFLDESLRSYPDYEFFIRLARHFNIQTSDDFYSSIRLHTGSESSLHIARGVRDRHLLGISKKFWGSSGSSEFRRYQISYALHWPKLCWRNHYEIFAFSVRDRLGIFFGSQVAWGRAPEIVDICLRYPFAAMAAFLKACRRAVSRKSK